MVGYRNWCFTLNNPTTTPNDDNSNEWWNRFTDLKYGICQLEKGESGTQHLQGYLEFSKQVTPVSMQRMLPGCYQTRRLGSRTQARDYCKKDETRVDGPWEYGEWEQEKGKRTDLTDIKDLLDNGKTESEIADSHFETWVKFHKGIREYKRMKEATRCEPTNFEVHIGEPGAGKTTGVMRDNPGAYWKTAGKWWDRYQGQDTVVLDEFVGWIPYHELMRLGDCTPLDLEVKGSTVQFLAKKVILISNKFPWDWYNYNEHKLDRMSLFRRIKTVYFHRKGQAPKEFTDWNDFVEFCKENNLI